MFNAWPTHNDPETPKCLLKSISLFGGVSTIFHSTIYGNTHTDNCCKLENFHVANLCARKNTSCKIKFPVKLKKYITNKNIPTMKMFQFTVLFYSTKADDLALVVNKGDCPISKSVRITAHYKSAKFGAIN